MDATKYGTSMSDLGDVEPLCRTLYNLVPGFGPQTTPKFHWQNPKLFVRSRGKKHPNKVIKKTPSQKNKKKKDPPLLKKPSIQTVFLSIHSHPIHSHPRLCLLRGLQSHLCRHLVGIAELRAQALRPGNLATESVWRCLGEEEKWLQIQRDLVGRRG